MMNPAVIGPPVAPAAGGEVAVPPDDAGAVAEAVVLAAGDVVAGVAEAELGAAELVGLEVAAVLVELEQADNTRAVAIRAAVAPAAWRVLLWVFDWKGMA